MVPRWGASTALSVLVFLLAAAAPPYVDGLDVPAGTALLETRVRWDEGLPFFPANEARHFVGRYATQSGRVTVYLVEADGDGGAPPPESARPVDPPCPVQAVLVHQNAFEIDLREEPVGYRIFLVSDSEPSRDGICSFAASFLDSFRFFRDAARERGVELTFDGSRVPEFPAVLDVVELVPAAGADG